MPKCTKVKNPCKICLGPVSEKTGLQCAGACQTWIHYECLNYTPGKIKDIKAGVIQVTCPCPDCKTSIPKEYRTDEPYSCTNIKCPANQPPKCANKDCPIGRNQEIDLPVATGCALDECGKGCKPNSIPHRPDSFQSSPVSPTEFADACTDCNACSSRRSSSKDIPGDLGCPRRNLPNINQLPSYGALEKMCTTVGQLTNQINDLMYTMKGVIQNRQENPQCKSQQKSGEQKGDRAQSQKPCYCPGNPCRK